MLDCKLAVLEVEEVKFRLMLRGRESKKRGGGKLVRDSRRREKARAKGTEREELMSTNSS